MLRVAEKPPAGSPERFPQADPPTQGFGPILLEEDVKFDHHGAESVRLGLLRRIDREGGVDEQTEDERQQQGDEPDHAPDGGLGIIERLHRRDEPERHAEEAGDKGRQRDHDRLTI